MRWLPEEPDQNMTHAAYKEQPNAINVGFAQAYRTMVAHAPKAPHPAVTALRALAIVETQKPGVQAIVVDGHRCRVCADKWPLNKPEQHQDWCVLKGSRL